MNVLKATHIEVVEFITLIITHSGNILFLWMGNLNNALFKFVYVK